MESQVDIYRRLAVDCICTPDHCEDENCPACNQLDPEWPCIEDAPWRGR